LLRLRQELARLNQPLPSVPTASVSDLAEARQRLTLQNIETREMEQSLSALQASIHKARADSTLLKHMNEELRKTLTAAEANAAELGTLVTRQAEELERAKATLLQEQLKTSEMKSEALVHSKGKPTSRRAPLWARTLPRASSATVRQLTIPLALLTDRDSDSSKTTPRITFPQRHPKTTR
jgi:septal ring factor EnvC (AmiA/AmiB activator)